MYISSHFPGQTRLQHRSNSVNASPKMCPVPRKLFPVSPPSGSVRKIPSYNLVNFRYLGVIREVHLLLGVCHCAVVGCKCTRVSIEQ